LERRGSRTREQPPTREARRDGFLATKNPHRAAMQVIGSEGVLLFREGEAARVHL
jgi:hypothetical protein